MDFFRSRGRYRNYISMQALVVAVVLTAFNTLAKEPASLLASSAFLMSSLTILYFEAKNRAWTSLSFATVLVFSLFAVAPTIALRILTLGADFNSNEIFGISGAQLHQFSRYLYLALVIGHFIDNYRSRARTQN